MSIETKVCRVLLDIVDVAKTNITTQLLTNSTSLGLTPDDITKISRVINSQLDTTFEAGINAIQRELSSVETSVSKTKKTKMSALEKEVYINEKSKS